MSGIFRQWLLCLIVASISVACSRPNSIYQGIDPEGDGVVSIIIPEDETTPEDEEVASEIEDEIKNPTPLELDVLTNTEKRYVRDLHNSEFDKLSFLVVDAKTDKIVKSYFGETPRRLASVTKIPTSLAALENVNNISHYKVGRMLKFSFNGEASRYLHLAARSIDGTTIEEDPYTERHSCPDPFLEEGPLAGVVFDWLKDQLPQADWTSAGLFDGAGCHYDNFMTPTQTIRILQLADSFGEAYGGKTFEELLSISGTDGTWRHRNKDHKGRIFAKTGTLRPNSNLAGYFYAKRNRKMHKYYFAVFVEKRGGGNHTTRSRKLIESLMRYWINFYNQSSGADLGDLSL